MQYGSVRAAPVVVHSRAPQPPASRWPRGRGTFRERKSFFDDDDDDDSAASFACRFERPRRSADDSPERENRVILLSSLLHTCPSTGHVAILRGRLVISFRPSYSSVRSRARQPQPHCEGGGRRRRHFRRLETATCTK